MAEGLTFPRHVHRRGGVYQVCPDESTYLALKAAGWVDHPLSDWPVPEAYHEWTPADDEPPPEPVKRGPGRPRKTAAVTPPED
jgi:hypothetical protein